MASPGEIMDVRGKTNEFTQDPWTDEDINALVDTLGSTDSAAAEIWRKKAAKYADLVNVSEAGASRALGDLHAKALAQAAHYEAISGEEVAEGSVGPAEVSVIRRTL